MPFLNLDLLYCVTAATGTDSDVNQAIAALSTVNIGNGVNPFASITQAVNSIPGLVQTIDAARQDPDDLYVTVGNNRGRAQAAWPGPDQSIRIEAKQSANPRISIPFEGNINVSLWDYDSVSDDDLLGSVTAFAQEAGTGFVTRLATNPLALLPRT